MRKNIIPIFFAIDDNYSPFLKIALKSIIDNSNSSNNYKVYVLHSNISNSNKDDINSLIPENFECEFVDINEKLKNIGEKLFTRDYYSKTTYYRLFIPNMFPEYNKAIYIDSDIAVNGDIADLYNYDIGDNLVGAVPDESVQIVSEFIDYVEMYLNIKHERYFNAGVLVMNLEELRKFNFEEKFLSLLNQIKFSVAQDQDYLNVLCKDRVCYLPLVWNKMPFENNSVSFESINLFHYNLSFKPWHYDGILYEQVFYKYAEKIGLMDFIVTKKKEYTDAEKEKDELCGKNLKQMAYTLARVDDTFKSLVELGKIKI